MPCRLARRTLRDEAEIARFVRRLVVTVTGAEERGPDVSREQVVPLVGIRMQVKLAEHWARVPG